MQCIIKNTTTVLAVRLSQLIWTSDHSWGILVKIECFPCNLIYQVQHLLVCPEYLIHQVQHLSGCAEHLTVGREHQLTQSITGEEHKVIIIYLGQWLPFVQIINQAYHNTHILHIRLPNENLRSKWGCLHPVLNGLQFPTSTSHTFNQGKLG